MDTTAEREAASESRLIYIQEGAGLVGDPENDLAVDPSRVAKGQFERLEAMRDLLEKFRIDISQVDPEYNKTRLYCAAPFGRIRMYRGVKRHEPFEWWHKYLAGAIFPPFTVQYELGYFHPVNSWSYWIMLITAYGKPYVQRDDKLLRFYIAFFLNNSCSKDLLCYFLKTFWFEDENKYKHIVDDPTIYSMLYYVVETGTFKFFKADGSLRDF